MICFNSTFFFNSTFGSLLPIPEQRVQAASDGQVFDLGGQQIHFLETPGHANHHGCFFAESSATIFTGDSFGLSYREFDGPAGPWLVATTTPVAFDPEAWGHSLDRMMALEPGSACITHFGRLDNPRQLAAQLRHSIQQHREIALREEQAGNPTGRVERLREALNNYMTESATGHNPAVSAERVSELMELDLTLNAQGLDIWLTRRER